MTTDAYLLSIRQREDKLRRLWFTGAAATADGAIRFTLGDNADKALRFPKALAEALAKITSTETYVVELVNPAMPQLAKLMAQ